MALTRAEILNMLRQRINMPLVDYTQSGWESSAAAADLQHGENILVPDLWQAMKEVAADSRDKWERRRIRIIAEQYEYPLPSNCMTVLEIVHNFYGDWQELDYLYHNEFFSDFSENVRSYPPRFFTMQAQTSNPVHYTGTITTANAATPPILIDTAANFGITLTGADINPGGKIFNIKDDSQGYVDYLYAATWKKEATCDTGSSATQLYDADAGFTTLATPVAVGDIVTRTPMPADSENGAWGVVTKVAANTLTVNHLYNHESGWSANDYYKVGVSTRIYLTSSGLVKDTEEGLVGGAEGDFDAADTYQIEDYYSTLDTLLLDSVPSTTDTLGTESLMLIYIPYPKQPLKHYHPVELSEAYTPALIAKMLEFAKARERSEEPRYEWLLGKGIGMRKIYNKGRLGHKRTHRRYPTNITSYQLENMVDQRGIT